MARSDFLDKGLTRGWRLLVAAALAVSCSPAFACDVTTPIPINVGTFSPASIKASAPFAKTGAGFNCSSFSVLTLLSGNFLKATVPTGTVLKLTSTTSVTDTVTYRLYADAAAATELKVGVAAYYMNGAALNLLNLLGDGSLDVPVYFKLASTGLVAPGTYTGTFSVKWDWNFCNGIAALGACVGVTDTGSKTGVVNVTLVVLPKPPTIAITPGMVTSDPVSGTSSPKSIPGSKRRLLVSITNPDIVATELNALAVLLPTPVGMTIALDGDGTGSGAVIQASEGSPASGLIFAYGGPGDTNDQVDFSNDGGSNWLYAPNASDLGSMASVTTTKFRPQGTMAASSSYTISVPYKVQ